MDVRIVRFYRQYLQQLDEISYPATTVLLEPVVQDEISHNFCDSSNGQHLPHVSYQRRVLKEITYRILSAIQDPNEDEVSDALMEHMAVMSTARPIAAFAAAQQRSIVSYHLPSDFSSQQPVCIYIEEARNLLAARGTTGLRVWDASLHLAYFLFIAGQSLINSKNVLELGAGTGLLSIFCAGPLKAHRVIATDEDAKVVEAIESNAALNAHLFEKLANKKNLDAKVLDWADTSALSRILRQEGEDVPLDVVLGADITYAVEALGPLVSLLSTLSKMYPKVDIIISTPIRNEDTFAAFVDTCTDVDFHISSIPFDCPPPDQQRGFFHPIVPPVRIVRLSQKSVVLPQVVD